MLEEPDDESAELSLELSLEKLSLELDESELLLTESSTDDCVDASDDKTSEELGGSAESAGDGWRGGRRAAGPPRTTGAAESKATRRIRASEM